jgi:hypothetical protein
MKNLVKNMYQVMAALVFVGGIMFSFLVAMGDDAPGFVIIGGLASLTGALALHGVGEMVSLQRAMKDRLDKIDSRKK